LAKSIQLAVRKSDNSRVFIFPSSKLCGFAPDSSEHCRATTVLKVENPNMVNYFLDPWTVKTPAWIAERAANALHAVRMKT